MLNCSEVSYLFYDNIGYNYILKNCIIPLSYPKTAVLFIGSKSIDVNFDNTIHINKIK